jgi:hypothetical protein
MTLTLILSGLFLIAGLYLVITGIEAGKIIPTVKQFLGIVLILFSFVVEKL